MPGSLPWIRSCVGPVTIASAIFSTVSDTRAIGDPTFSTVERPTIRSISEPLTASRTGLAAVVRGRRRIEGLRLLGLRRGNQDDDDVDDQRRKEGGRPAASLWPRSPDCVVDAAIMI